MAAAAAAEAVAEATTKFQSARVLDFSSLRVANAYGSFRVTPDNGECNKAVKVTAENWGKARQEQEEEEEEKEVAETRSLSHSFPHVLLAGFAGQFYGASKQANQSFIQYGNFWKTCMGQLQQQQHQQMPQQEQHIVAACLAACRVADVVLGAAL